MHGDSAFAGQGIAAEALNFAALEGFAIGGTFHIVVNNLIGFTTEPAAYSSTRYATDIAKRLPIPIFHVNAEEPEAAVRVARIAVDYRTRFASDVVIDLIGYRRWGHSEVDDPTVTQPLLYRRIKAMPPLWRSYAERIGVARRGRVGRRGGEGGTRRGATRRRGAHPQRRSSASCRATGRASSAASTSRRSRSTPACRRRRSRG